MYSEIASSLALYSARTENAHVGEIVYKLVFYSARLKRTWLVRLNSCLALYSARTENAHVE